MSAETRDTHADDGRGQANGPSELVLHPTSGEVLGKRAELASLPPETLADALLALDEQAKRLRETRKLLDGELSRRLDIRGRDKLAFGAFELHRTKRSERVWDGDELELVLRRLIDEGVVAAHEVIDVITHETTVSKAAAARLLDRLATRERRAVEACFHWKSTSGRIEVVRSIPLLPE